MYTFACKNHCIQLLNFAYIFLLITGIVLLPQSGFAGKPAKCTEADWIYSDSDCLADNTFIRTWTKTKKCIRGVRHPSSELLTCVYASPECTEDDWSYFDGPCQQDYTVARTWTKNSDCDLGVSHPDTEILACTAPETMQRYVKVYSPYVNFSTSVYNPDVAAKVVSDMKEQGITELIVSLSPNSLQWSGYYSNFVDFLDLASNNDMKVHLRILQTATYTYEENHFEALSRVQKCVDFIISNPSYHPDPIKSIYLNIEPNTLDEWKSADWDSNVSVRRDIMSQWLTLMNSIHAKVKDENGMVDLKIYAGIDYYYDSKYRQEIFPEGNPSLIGSNLDGVFVMAYFDDTNPTRLTTQEKLEYLVKVSQDEVAATPTSIAIDVRDYADYEEVQIISDSLDAYFQESATYLGVTYLKYETLQGKYVGQ